MKIYLDNCCYNRPFDDQTQERIHLESEAILMILKRAEEGKYEIIGSDVLYLEIERMSDPIKRQRVRELYSISTSKVLYSDDIRTRAAEIMMHSRIRTFDSLHISSAEAVGADVLLTTDDKLEKMAAQLDLKVIVMNPLKFIWEEM